ncbi:MAG: hypothetical protein GY796_12250 [Chloroflexi bacterium]|nr:hypothetical protein [Chloroflexota bacterium]
MAHQKPAAGPALDGTGVDSYSDVAPHPIRPPARRTGTPPPTPAKQINKLIQMTYKYDSELNIIHLHATGVLVRDDPISYFHTIAEDSFGIDVAIDSDVIVVGAFNEDSNATGVNGYQTNDLEDNAGAAYLFAGARQERVYLPFINKPAAAPSPTPTPPNTPTPTPSNTPSTTPDPSYQPGDCVTDEEAQLVTLINDYRNQNGLPNVPVSKSLVTVAQWHVINLDENNPDSGTDPNSGLSCNMHSWSDQHPSLWTPVCYTSDHAYAQGMWFKPREISGNVYTGYGYENAYGSSGQATAVGAFNGWRNSPPHNDVILEQGIWNGYNWPAMGVSIYEHHAVLWFGDISDPQGSLNNCQ